MSPFYETLLLFAIGFIAGVINTVSGGGSMLTLPVLIFLGLESSVANGTNRIAILVQNISALAGFKSKGVTTDRTGYFLGIAALIGSVIGAVIAIDIDDALFNRILAIVMMVVVGVMVVKPKKKLEDLKERFHGKYFWLSILAFFFIGIYGGFIQAGTGILMMLALSSINHVSLIKSNVYKAIVMLIYTVATLLVFGLNDKLNLKMGLLLAAGQAVGAWLTSRWSVNKGDGLVKVFLVLMALGMAVKLWYS